MKSPEIDIHQPSKPDYLFVKSPACRFFCILLISLLAAFLRFYRLAIIPPGLWYDEAIYALDAKMVLAEGPQIFFTTEAHPREPLFIHIVALFFLLFSPTPETLRAVSAFIGLITVPLLYYFVLRLTRNFPLALLSAFFLATLRWHLHFSRLGFRTILVAPVMLLLFTYLLLALTQNNPRQKRWAFLLSGIFLALGAYTYLAFRLVPLIVLLVLLYAVIKKIISLKECLRGGLILLASALIVFSPLLVDYIQRPFHFYGRTDEVSLFDKGASYALKSISQNFLSVMLMFSFRGDHVAKHNIPLQPVLDPLSSIIFYLGIAVAIYNALKKSDIFSASVLLWFFTLLFASILSFGAPNLLRTLGATPVVALLLSSGLIVFYSWLRRFMPEKIALILVMLMLFFFAGTQAKQYFIDWYRLPKTWQELNSNIVELTKFINGLPEGRYFIYLPADIYNHPSFRFVNHHPDVMPAQSLEQILSQQPQRPHLIIATQYGDLYRSNLLQSIPAIVKVQSLETFGYGEWAHVFLLRAEELLPPQELNSLLQQLKIVPHRLRLYF